MMAPHVELNQRSKPSIETGVSEIVEALLPAVRRAGDAVMRIRGEGFKTRAKQDASPVTTADLASHDILTQAVGAICPGVELVSEEDVDDLPDDLAGDEPSAFFLIDPLDGTRDFCAGRRHFTINVALVAGHFPIMGIVHAPVSHRTYAAVGSRAFLEESGGRLDLSALPPPTRPSPLVLQSRSHPDPGAQALVGRLGACKSRRLGSALKFALIATGEADIYPRLSPTRGWDTAAGQALIEAVGGVIIALDGSRLAYRRATGLRNPGFIAARTLRLAEAALKAARPSS